jgi:hypothetical protein
MNAKEMRKAMAEQIRLVRDDAGAIKQADAVSNLVGKMAKILMIELQAEALREAGKTYSVLADILDAEKT